METIEIKKGHFYTLKLEGIRVKVLVTDLIGSRYAKVKQPGGKEHTCGTHQLRQV